MVFDHVDFIFPVSHTLKTQNQKEEPGKPNIAHIAENSCLVLKVYKGKSTAWQNLKIQDLESFNSKGKRLEKGAADGRSLSALSLKYINLQKSRLNINTSARWSEGERLGVSEFSSPQQFSTSDFMKITGIIKVGWVYGTAPDSDMVPTSIAQGKEVSLLMLILLFRG